MNQVQDAIGNEADQVCEFGNPLTNLCGIFSLLTLQVSDVIDAAIPNKAQNAAIKGLVGIAINARQNEAAELLCQYLKPKNKSAHP